MRVPSPVKVVPHFRLNENFPDENWRRFSTNFMDPQATVESSPRQEQIPTQQGSDTTSVLGGNHYSKQIDSLQAINLFVCCLFLYMLPW